MIAIPAETVYRYSRIADRPEAQTIFISCADLRVTEVSEVIESDLGKSAIPSNQVPIWAMLRRAKVKGPIKDFGALLDRL
jgi:maleate isomerase